mmetsp:Transcript_76111/g.126853  ORF Transcript_76111/g.126853 Transcript_76111/m.126853 type:complete len:343 (+) Transcript_76111:111-1139(+)|eukprot:CAMPEP_0119309000 /NCGR_PEP_ID=MMETSP1333-20130426/13503_1 /TAXON_ID=418940 /ORGANISM="Scyphosphaera apsteinii, Strain RCC1455" /LENGTH=342 /DNA_ID=CAMNT_0007312901 /DNA_START=107 /DNA_END=1135 /DNA_ORIENTATION=+
MNLQCKLGSRNASLKLADQSIDALRAAIREAFELEEDAELKILAKGKALSTDSQVSTLAAGSKLMVMSSKRAERAAVDEAPRERMRGFEEDDLRQRTGSVGKALTGSAAAYKTRSVGPTYKFHALKPLSVLPPGVTPGVSAVQQRLKELSEDPAILGVMKKHQFQIGCLSEMPPEGQVGVDSECIMGLNKNAGQEILLRVRTDDGQGLRSYQSLVPVLLHELTHNVWSGHDNNFKTLCSQLNREYKELQEPGYPATRSDASASGSSEDAAGHVLGGSSAASMAEARAKAFGFAFYTTPSTPVPASAEDVDVTDAEANTGCVCGMCVITIRPSECGSCKVAEG